MNVLIKYIYNFMIIFVIAALGWNQIYFSKKVHIAKLLDSSGSYWGTTINTTMARRFLGFKIVISDLIWLDLLIKSDIVREKKEFTPFYTAVKSIMDLNPNNFMAAWFGGLYLSVIKDDIVGASMLFREAVSTLEKSPWVNAQLRGSIYFAYGYHLLFEEHDITEAAIWIRKSADNPNAPLLAKALAIDMASEKGRLDVGARVLNDFYKRARTPEEKKKIETKMLVLLAKKEIVELNELFSDYRVKTNALNVPYKRAYQIFLRSIQHSGKDILGRKLTVNENGTIQSEGEKENL